MSIAAVQQIASAILHSGSPVTQITLTPSANGSAGNMVLVCGNAGAGHPITTVTDTRGNTWTVGPNPGATGAGADTAWTFQDAHTLTTADTITVTFSAGGANKVALAWEFSGVASVSPLDVSGFNNAASSGGSATTSSAITNANDLLVGVWAWSQTTTQLAFTQGTGFTLAGQVQEGAGAFEGIALEYQILSGATLATQTVTGSLNGTPSTASRGALCFKPTAGSTTVALPVATAEPVAYEVNPQISSTGVAPVGLLATGVSTANSATQNLSPSSNAQSGSLLVLAANPVGGHTLASVTDTKSNTWTIGPNPGNTASQSLTAWTSQDGGTLTETDVITIAYNTSSSNKVALIFEFEGQDVTPFDVSGTTTGASSSPSVSTSSAISNSDDLLIGVFAWAKSSGPQLAFSPGSGYTLGGQTLENDTNTYAGVALEYRVLSGAPLAVETADGAVSALPSSGSYTILAFRPVASAVTIALPVASATPSAFALAVNAGGWSNIGGATNSSYIPVSGDAGKLLRCRVTATNTTGSAVEFTAATSAVSGTAVAPTAGAPTIDVATPIFGQTINAQTNDGTWDGTHPLTYTYQWQTSNNGTTWTNATGAGATTSAYTVASADVGLTLRVQITGTNGGGAFTANSPATRAVTLSAVAPTRGQPALSDSSPNVGQQIDVLANAGSWDGTLPLTFAYLWQVSASGVTSWSTAPGAGANTASYTVASSDEGKFLRCSVTATNIAGSFTQPTPASGVVGGSLSDLINTTAPMLTTIHTPPSVGDTISTDAGVWGGSTPITYGYQWQHSSNGVDWANTSGLGATTPVYTVDQTDVGLDIRALVTANNATGSNFAASGVTPAVVIGNFVTTSEVIFLSTGAPTPPTLEDQILVNLNTGSGSTGGGGGGNPPEAVDALTITLDTTPPVIVDEPDIIGRINFLRYCGVEVSNQARVLSYLQRGLAGPLFDVGVGDICATLYVEAGNALTFNSPAADAAPWYDPNRPESADFLGLLLTEMQVFNEVEARTPADVMGGLGGAVFGPRRRSGRQLFCSGSMIAATPQGLDYGLQWLKSVLQTSACDDCSTCFADIRTTCPPSDGSDPDRGAWRLLDCALVDGPKVDQTYDYDCAFLTDVEFTIQSERPYLYKLPQICVSAQELLVDDGSTACIAFDQWLCGPPTQSPICCTIDTPVIGSIAAIATIQTSLGVGGVLIASYPTDSPQPGDIPISQMLIPYLPPNSTMVLDSSTHQAIYIAPDGSQTDGTPYISLPAGRSLAWVEVAACDAAKSICISPLHPCSGGIGTFVSVNTVYRED